MSNGFKLVSLHYPFNQPKAIRITQHDVCNRKGIEYCSSFIRENNIEQAEIITSDISFLNEFSKLKHLKIHPDRECGEIFDFSPLYQMPEVLSLSVQNVYGANSEFSSVIDYARVNGLVDLFVQVNKKTKNFNKISSLKTLRISRFKGAKRDLTDLFCSSDLDTLEMIQCGITSLKGIDISQKMQCLYLYYNRALSDISELSKVKNTLKALRIGNCPSIKDFSVLSELTNLELLELTGSNELPSLNFLKEMKSLKTLIFSMNVLDGDLSPCLTLSYVSSSKMRKHYNLPQSCLPKNHYYRGNEDIESWRRLE